MSTISSKPVQKTSNKKQMQSMLVKGADSEYCSQSNMNMNVGASHIEVEDLGQFDDEYDLDL